MHNSIICILKSYQHNIETSGKTLEFLTGQTVHMVSHYPKSQVLQAPRCVCQPDQQTDEVCVTVPDMQIDHYLNTIIQTLI